MTGRETRFGSSFLVRGLGGLVLGLGLVGILTWLEQGLAGPTAREHEPSVETIVPPAVSQAPEADRLALVSLRGYEDSSGYQHVTGRVANISDASLEDVTVVVAWYTDWGDLVTMREGPLRDGPIVPGQTTAFDIRGPVLPYATTYSAAFIDAAGDTLLDVDSSWTEVR